jgi:putative hydrolase of the HAD superfamily
MFAPVDAPLRGLLVDFGGVLTSDVFVSFAQFCTAHGLPAQTVRDLFRADPAARQLLVDLETGVLGTRAFEKEFAALLGVEPDDLVARLMAGTSHDTAMLDAVRAARAAGLRTGLISNSWGNERYDRALLAELFDGVVISGEVGLRKPAEEIYRLGAEAVGLAPAACAYVDDLGGNLKPARALGMTTFLHRSAEETVPALERALGVSLSR